MQISIGISGCNSLLIHSPQIIRSLKSRSHQSPSCTNRRTWTTCSARLRPPGRPAVRVSAGSQTGWSFPWGSWASRSRRVAHRRTTSTCWRSSCRTHRWWRTLLWRTVNRLETTTEYELQHRHHSHRIVSIALVLLFTSEEHLVNVSICITGLEKVRMKFLRGQIINAHKGSRWHLPNSRALFYLCCFEHLIYFPLPVGGKMASVYFEAGFPVYFNAVSYSAVAIFALAEVIFHCCSGPHVSVPQLNRLKLQSVRCSRPKSQQGPPEGHRGSRSDRHGHHPNCLPHNATAHAQCRVPVPPACVFVCVCVCACVSVTTGLHHMHYGSFQHSAET